ncbi:MAG: hypothetical protein ONB31_14155 [candidate division KSB1 bacterium]|nr:hypothetical protein [candidate division KSB1 bacterium]MDZ7336724.1 hypothetical protein [candidate division KSB1 bacterium]MDZ7358428.1 hypothetical protein [candidate division KSB1 bacterium]MDZ7401798.1 hypothetical protein [candidate division KSB1 bacterium]
MKIMTRISRWKWFITFFFVAILYEPKIFAQTIQPSYYDQNMLVIPEGQSRTFMFTNRKGLFYYGETGLPNTSPLNGLSYLTHKFLEDYIIEIGGSPLSRAQAEAHLMANRLVRHFKNLSVEEEISIADSLLALIIKIRGPQKAPLAIAPLISSANEKQHFQVDWSQSDRILFISRANLATSSDKNPPAWLAITTYPEGDFSSLEIEKLPIQSKLSRQPNFCPGKIHVLLDSEVIILFIVGNNKNELLKSRNLMLKQLNIEIRRKNDRIEGIRETQLFLSTWLALSTL